MKAKEEMAAFCDAETVYQTWHERVVAGKLEDCSSRKFERAKKGAGFSK